ncbi:MAG: hypothetical protein C5B49_16210 [Bdellovibrio sp.]|nr:MAG: hypothetical protein C5B49_16210 [Bdellovibrio sp.]
MPILFFSLFVVVSPAWADTARILTRPTGLLAIELTGDFGGPADEIYSDMAHRLYEGWEVERVDLNDGSTLQVLKSLRAFYNPKKSSPYTVQIELFEGGKLTEQELNEGIQTGRIDFTSLAFDPLLRILEGDNDSDENHKVTSGDFIRCMDPSRTSAEPQCSISLSKHIDSAVPGENCELFIDRVATINEGPAWGHGQQVAFVVKVREDLRPLVSSIQFKKALSGRGMNSAVRLRPVATLPGSYRLDLNTISNIHDVQQREESHQGYLQLKLTDGRVYNLVTKSHGGLTVGTGMAKEIPAQIKRELQDSAIASLVEPTSELTIDLASELNPRRCR